INLEEIITTEQIISLQREARNVLVSDIVMDYLIELVHTTRLSPEIDLGISPRGMLGLMRAAQAKALLRGRDYVSPNDIQTLAPYVFEHRIILSMEASLKRTTQEVMNEVIAQVP